jgi:NTP pyrophosphatase (non-canonical NTP hydrolase)
MRSGRVTGPVEGQDLAGQLARYLEARQLTLSTAQLPSVEQLRAGAAYVLGEAIELHDAVVALCEAEESGEVTAQHLRNVRHEIADVTLADTVLAGMMPGTVTVEACIAEKTEADRGRG